MTVIGTLLHELGHYTVARLLGYEAAINYQSSWFWNKETDYFLTEVEKQYSNEIKNDLDFPDKAKYIAVKDKYIADQFRIILGGPLQTILTGTIGLVFLLYFKNKIVKPDKLTVSGWSFVFLTLFWLRQSANLFMAVLYLIKNRKPSLSGDEMRLALHLDINVWTIQLVTGIISLFVLFYVFKLIPKNQKFTFLLSGLVGGITGYYLWLIKFGQLIMP